MLAAIGARFAIEGEYVDGRRYGGGHINDTFFATYRCGTVLRRYVHQRINPLVFPNAPALHENIALVTRHLRAKAAARWFGEELDRRVLRLVPTRDGANVLVTDSGEYWRTYAYAERTVTRMQVRTPDDAYSAGHAFGAFAAALADLAPNQLHEPIAGFHDTAARFCALVDAVEADVCNRAHMAKREIERAMRLDSLAGALQCLAERCALPVRVTHNDAKITNVLFDEAGLEAVCVVDLDTVMPGLALFDVGELIRTAATLAAEDEPDECSVRVDASLFHAVACGYLAGSQNLCSAVERDAFVTAGKVLAYENGLRFLADHLSGDRYFRVLHADHNLIRARAQFAIVDSLDRQEEALLARLRRDDAIA